MTFIFYNLEIPRVQTPAAQERTRQMIWWLRNAIEIVSGGYLDRYLWQQNRSDFCRSTIVYDIVFFVDIRRVAVLFVIDLFEDMIFSRTGGTSTNRWLYHTLPDIHLFRKKQKRFSKTKSYGNDWNRHCMWLVMFVAATNPAAFELLLSEMFGAGIQTVSTYREG